MGFFQKLFGSHSTERDPGSDFWYEGIAAAPSAGFPVTLESALQVPAVYDCCQVISRPIASLPLQIFRRLPGGGKEPFPQHPLHSILSQPNERDSAFVFRGQMQFDLCLHNTAFAEKIRTSDSDGPFAGLKRLDPQTVTLEQGSGDRIAWIVKDKDGTQRRLDEGQVWVLRGLPLRDDGIQGRPQLETARQTISAALAVMDYGARFFANDTKSGGVIEYPGRFKDKESQLNWLSAWRRARSGANRHKDAILEDGAKYVRTSTTNEEAQFLETRKNLWVEIAEIWQVPPHKIGVLDRATFSNIEQQALEFVTDTMLPWFELWEQSISSQLLVQGDDEFFAEFNVAGLLRGDIKARFDAYSKARQWGWLSVNEIRGFENMNPVEGGDEYLRPMNMQPIDEENREIGMDTTIRQPNGPEQNAKVQAFLECLAEQEVRDAIKKVSLNGTGHA